MKERRTTDPRFIARRAIFDALNKLVDAMRTLDKHNNPDKTNKTMQTGGLSILLLEATRQHLLRARDLINEALRQLPKIKEK